MNKYQKQGYENRAHYLQCLAEDFCVDELTVKQMADVLGPSEDFDGLVIEVEDYSYTME